MAVSSENLGHVVVEREDVLQFVGGHVAGNADVVGEAAETDVREAAERWGIGNAAQSVLRRHVGLAAYLQIGGVQPVVACPEFIGQRGREEVTLADDAALAVVGVLTIATKAAAVEDREGRSECGGIVGIAVTSECLVLGGRVIVDANIVLSRIVGDRKSVV